jgi:hypothetical protein
MSLQEVFSLRTEQRRRDLQSDISRRLAEQRSLAHDPVPVGGSPRPDVGDPAPSYPPAADWPREPLRRRESREPLYGEVGSPPPPPPQQQQQPVEVYRPRSAAAVEDAMLSPRMSPRPSSAVSGMSRVSSGGDALPARAGIQRPAGVPRLRLNAAALAAAEDREIVSARPHLGPRASMMAEPIPFYSPRGGGLSAASRR